MERNPRLFKTELQRTLKAIETRNSQSARRKGFLKASFAAQNDGNGAVFLSEDWDQGANSCDSKGEGHNGSVAKRSGRVDWDRLQGGGERKMEGQLGEQILLHREGHGDGHSDGRAERGGDDDHGEAFVNEGPNQLHCGHADRPQDPELPQVLANVGVEGDPEDEKAQDDGDDGDDVKEEKEEVQCVHCDLQRLDGVLNPHRVVCQVRLQRFNQVAPHLHSQSNSIPSVRQHQRLASA